MKQWIDQTQILLDWVTEAEEALHSITKLIAEEDSILGLLWDGVVGQSMPEGVTLEGVKEALTSLRDELTALAEAMRDRGRRGEARKAPRHERNRA